MSKAQDKAFMDMVEKMPFGWTCIRCNGTWPNHRQSTHPYAIQHERGKIIGDICKDCYERKEANCGSNDLRGLKTGPRGGTG